ncbi:hypothetical protein BDZ45DRAFT_745051 [Acephala macrosclerotiorum]|nr:hypothetical protein BDZ45DRAFT_745051 [Acephala macrosclerotiorum]
MLTNETLIDLLEKQRCTFTDQYRPLLTAQEIAFQKANGLIAEPLESLKRNYSRKKAYHILNDIRNCISHDVFVLCALATNLSALGTSKLLDHVSKIGCWWEGVQHPKGLTMVSERYGMRISKTLSNGKIESNELPESQPSPPTVNGITSPLGSYISRCVDCMEACPGIYLG